MTREEIKNKINDLEERIFYINMIDRWTNDDGNRWLKYTNEVIELKNKLKEMEEE